MTPELVLPITSKLDHSVLTTQLNFGLGHFFMIGHFQNCLRRIRFLTQPSISRALLHASSESFTLALPVESSYFSGSGHQVVGQYDIDVLIGKVRVGSSHEEVFQCLMSDRECNAIQLSHDLVEKLLHRFNDDWKSALGAFKWAASHPGYKPSPQAYDLMVDILGKMKQMDHMKDFLEEMRQGHFVTLNTIAKVMRRFAGAREWENAVRIFDELETFGLEKNTYSMNLLLDTLCKEKYVERAREIFLLLKSHIAPDAHTFNIFIHGWCKINRVDEAHWSIQEMKGHGFHPSVISYTTIIQFYCCQCNFRKVYELLDEMAAQGCPPNAVTYTTVMSSLLKAEMFEEALQISLRLKTAGCKPDTLFYNCLIHVLGRAGQVKDAAEVFEVEMPKIGVAPNTSTYNCMIAMLCHHAQQQRALTLLQEMENSKICKPDVQTYYPLLKSCFKTGKIDSLLSKLLNDMVNKHHLSLDISAYSLLIHGLCRANRTQWAYSLFEAMIRKDITPKYRTCRLLFDEVKEKNMYDAVEKIEGFMKKL
ncbi:Pentatricopeptide repeat - like 10 [Theobroma cacao]|nr:Pentatricopeptide repeat - like 10 [Theobroma cacao]